MDYIDKIEQRLGRKFITGTNADWSGARILPIKGNNFYGLFLLDLKSFHGEDKVVLMCRILNPTTEEVEDTDILEYDDEIDNLELFLEKLDWI
jgi:hypothetical protein